MATFSDQDTRVTRRYRTAGGEPLHRLVIAQILPSAREACVPAAGKTGWDGIPVEGNEWEGGRGGSVKKNEDFLFFFVDLIQIAGFMLNQRENGPSSSP